MLEGTINTPIGNVSKKTAAIVGGGVAILGVIIWYRGKQAADAALSAAGQSDINPATGFPYGSQEDADALAAQASYINPGVFGGGGGGSGGGGSIPSSPGTFTNNAQWSQWVVQYMTDNAIVADASVIAAALGKYLAGSSVTSDQANLVQQAIALGGYPPIAGTNGYPPAINIAAGQPPTTPPPSTNPPATTPPKPTGISVTQVGDPTKESRIILRWNGIPGVSLYNIGIRLWGSAAWSAKSGFDLLYQSGPTSEWTSAGFTRHQGYDFYVAAANNGQYGGPASLVIK